MKITSKHKMSDLPKVLFIEKYSEIKLMEEIKKFDVPKEIKGIQVKDNQDISIGDMLEIWDITDQNTLFELTARVFLDLKLDKIPRLPLIDFLRLAEYTNETSLMAANLFKSLSRDPKDVRIKDILMKYKGSAFGIIARFCTQFPVYTLEEAKKLSWVKIYLAFEEKTKENDIQLEISELK